MRNIFLTLTLTLILILTFLISPLATAHPSHDEPITHSFLITGSLTQIIGEDGKVEWKYPHPSRDGYVLGNGKIILTLNNSSKYKGGSIVLVTRHIKKPDTTKLIFQGAQSELNSAQPLQNGNLLVTESGAKPRLLEISMSGKIKLQFPLKCQLGNHHLQTRMARKLKDGTYLVPHLLDFAVKQYNKKGEVIKVYDTTQPGDKNHKIRSWPFTAIKMPNGNIHVNCTNGNLIQQFNPAGKVVWKMTNKDLDRPLFADPCGAQLLPNGNLIITSYGQGNKSLPRLLEITPDKKIVWTHTRPGPGMHTIQILTTNGKKLKGKPNK